MTAKRWKADQKLEVVLAGPRLVLASSGQDRP